MTRWSLFLQTLFLLHHFLGLYSTQQEVHQLRRENGELKELVADLSLEAYRLKKNGHPDAPGRHWYHRMSAAEKAEVLTKVASSPLPKRKVLGELGIPKSTYYRWLSRQDHEGLEDHAGGGKPPWNRLTFQEVHHLLSVAREMPELSCRQLAAWITDNQGYSVSESTVYRILRREGFGKES